MPADQIRSNVRASRLARPHVHNLGTRRATHHEDHSSQWYISSVNACDIGRPKEVEYSSKSRKRIDGYYNYTHDDPYFKYNNSFETESMSRHSNGCTCQAMKEGRRSAIPSPTPIPIHRVPSNARPSPRPVKLTRLRRSRVGVNNDNEKARREGK